MKIVSSEILAIIDQLQSCYITSLDEKDMRAWLATFRQCDNASYICRSAENDSQGHRIALMMDDCYARLKDRVVFITKIWKGTYQDYRTRHFCQRVSCEQNSNDTYKIKSNFKIEYTFDPCPTATLTAGLYEDIVEVIDNEAKFVSKYAVYDTNVLPQYVVYPF